jgi:hypothetical protein
MGNWIHYSSLYTGHGTLSGTAGELVTILDNCLVSGSASQSVTGITRSGATATATVAAHGIGIGQTGWRTISGANESDYNGTYLVTSVTATTFSYTVANSPTTPATGTIAYNTPGSGWTIAYSATNKRSYRMGSGALARKYFRVNDNAAGTGGAKEALIRGFNAMSDVDSGTAAFPTSGQSVLTENSLVIRKSNTATSTVRAWDIWADDRTFILLIANGDVASTYSATYAGEYYTMASGDTTCAMLSAKLAENGATYANDPGFVGNSVATAFNGGMVTTHNRYTCGDLFGANASTICGIVPMPFQYHDNGVATQQSNGIIPYPNPLDGGLYLYQPLLYRSSGASTPVPFGYLRGVYIPMHLASAFTDGDTFSGTGNYSGKSFMIRKSIGYNNYAGTTASDGCIALENSTNPIYST